MYTWDALKKQCEISKVIVGNYRSMFESIISAGSTGKLPCSENLRISSWSYDMEGDAKKCVERYCELANKTTQTTCKVSTPCLDDHQFKEEEVGSVGELPKVWSQNCSEMLILGTYLKTWYSMVNEQTFTIDHKMDQKPVTKRLNRLISYIHHTCENKQYCHVGNNAEHCRLGLFQDSDFAGDLEDSKSTSGGTLCVFWKSYICSDKLDV